MVCVRSMAPPTCACFKCDGTVVQQVGFERPWHRLSEVVDFDSAWRRNERLEPWKEKNKMSQVQREKDPPFFSLMVMMEPPPIPML